MQHCYMRRAWLLSWALAACGSELPAQFDASPDAVPDAETRDVLLERLLGLPGVTASEYTCRFDRSARCFDLSIEQPVDHDAPDATFQQVVTLVHAGFDRPVVTVTTGYWNFYEDYPFELTALLDANQIVIEHRYFRSSRPAILDWTKLTIRQSAADQHRITQLLRTLYPQPWVTTGASKGGMTASYHRRFYPDDVAGTVPYVAPLSFAHNDTRYATFMDTVGPETCRHAIRAAMVEMLSDARFEEIVQSANRKEQVQGTTFHRVALRPAVESAITSLEWAFWQYAGTRYCGQVPAATSSTGDLWAFLDMFSPVASDGSLDAYEPYFYQTLDELGFPDDGTADYTAGLLRYTAEDYAGVYPRGVALPTFQPEVMLDIDQWVRTEGRRFLFVYGEWDPWSAGKYELGAASDSQRSVVAQATHAASLVGLDPADKAAAYAKLEAWTHVSPDESRLARMQPLPPLAMPRIPSTLHRALSYRRAQTAGIETSASGAPPSVAR